MTLFLIGGLNTACVSSVRDNAGGPELTAESPVWPSAPEQARIRFVRSVAHPADLGIKPSIWKRILGAIRGEEEHSFVRPGGVVVQGDIIYVADPGAKALWIVNPGASRFSRIREAGEEKLMSPVSVAAGPDGSVYVADSYLAKIFIFASDGELIGTISDAKFQRPAGVAYDHSSDRLYVADSAAHQIWVFAGEGTLLGEIGGRGAGDGEFNFPTHVAVDQQGSVYVTDALGFRIQRLAQDGRFVAAFGHHGNGSGDFAAPKGVAVDSDGHIYVVDALFDAVQIFDEGGRFLLGFGERGVDRGQFWLPGSLYIDADDKIYVADGFNKRIQIFEYLAGDDDG
ncbi:MAG: 6-bladed beta-propeller [Gammaproteobacteria bacterium]|nr:6-bladed beta-propeller [Gammaproteobacteria bacterium]